jgi:hypothetical protein
VFPLPKALKAELNPKVLKLQRIVDVDGVERLHGVLVAAETNGLVEAASRPNGVPGVVAVLLPTAMALLIEGADRGREGIGAQPDRDAGQAAGAA